MEIITEEHSGGLKHLFLTPHINGMDEFSHIPRIQEHFNILTEKCRIDFPNLRLYLGYEVGPSFDIAKEIKKYDLTLNSGKYILIGPFFSQLANNVSQILFNLQSIGLTPIIAHPERMFYYQENPKILEEYVNKGMLLQINIQSLLGRYGKETEEFAAQILDHGWASFAATDTHKKHGKSVVYKGYNYIRKNWGEDTANNLLINNGQKLINNEDITLDHWKEWTSSKRSFWDTFKNKLSIVKK